MKILTIGISLLVAAGLPAQASALCRGSTIGTGYVVAFGDCYGSRIEYRDPQNVCERASNGREPRPLIVSDVFYYESDATRRGTALSLFHEEVTIQKRIDAMASSDTVCYETRREAEDYRRRMMTRAARADRRISNIYIDNERRR